MMDMTQMMAIAHLNEIKHRRDHYLHEYVAEPTEQEILEAEAQQLAREARRESFRNFWKGIRTTLATMRGNRAKTAAE